MKLTTYEISEAFEFGAYTRGKKYFLDGKVSQYSIKQETKSTLKLKAMVAGSQDNTYLQDIVISKHANGHSVKIQGQCSCPVRVNCKHVVAVCFQYQYDKANKDRDFVYEWLSEISDKVIKTIPQATHSDAEHFLTYRLFQGTGMEVDIYRSKILKNGRLSKGGKRVLENVYYSLFDDMDNDDKAIIELLDANSARSYHYQFKGEFGFIVLQKIIQTGRAYYKDNEQALVFNQQKINLQTSWQKANSETSKLAINLAQEKYHIIPTIPILVIDSEKNEMRQLENTIDIDILKSLLKAPAIENHRINTVFSTICSLVDDVELPMPEGYKVEEIKETAIPVIRIFQQYNQNYVNYFIAVEFSYGNFRLDLSSRDEIYSAYEDDGKFEIYRDIRAENAAIKKLESYGFTSCADNDKSNLTITAVSSQDALSQWQIFLDEHVPHLQELGWQVEFDENFQLSFTTETAIEVESEEQNDWFSLSFNIKIGDETYPLAPLVYSILDGYDDFKSLPGKLFIRNGESEYFELKTKELQPVFKTLFELFDRQSEDDNLKIGAFDAHMLADMEDVATWKGSKEILKLSKKLKDFKGIKAVTPPSCLKLKLRDYQQLGLNWLNFLYQFKFSGILADDMGLGKTVQTLAHLSRLKEDKLLKKPALIIVPTSLIANWKNEVEKFTPNLKILTLYGLERKKKFKEMDDNDLILTTYNLLSIDKEQHESRQHSYIILDEAQKIKNPRTKMAKAIATLKSENRLALTGTPIENHLGELWSLFNFLMPGFLHNQKLFNEYYRKPIEKEGNRQMQEQLNKRIGPFILRRTKNEVLTELPPKTEIIKLTQFDAKQSKLYETIRIAMNKKVSDAVAKKGLNKSHIHILDALLKLRQVCCDPSILKLSEAKKVKESAKLALFLDLIDELMAEGRKVLVFSQFTTMLSILEREIKQRKISYLKLTGSSTKRDKIIEKFTNGEADIFLISLKAGGVGLNLVEADTVIHYDPWWNPAVENQATDRAHRIGQNKKVFVYKLIVANTIEEKILELQKKKKALQEGIYAKGGKLEEKKFSGNELIALLQNPKS